MIACVHQPNYLPWLGFFAKLAAADIYVVMDNVQFPRSSVCNRVRVAGNGAPLWLSVPVREPKDLTQTIAAKDIDYDRDWVRAHVGTLRARYGRCAHFARIMAALTPILESRPARLGDLNLALIRAIAELCGITRRIVLGSALAADGKGSALIARMCHGVGADVYLAGRGGAAYDDLDAYREARLAYRRADYRDVPYPQRGAQGFVPGLSTVDALFNVGPEETAHLLGANLALVEVGSP